MTMASTIRIGRVDQTKACLPGTSISLRSAVNWCTTAALSKIGRRGADEGGDNMTAKENERRNKGNQADNPTCLYRSAWICLHVSHASVLSSLCVKIVVYLSE